MRILVGDDEPLARRRLTHLLKTLGGCEQVGEAANGRDVIEKTQQLKPDLVLLDIRMPDMDGLEAAAHLRLCQPSPAVIFCTAYDEHALAAFKVQAFDYLLKPVSRHALQDALTRVKKLVGNGEEEEGGQRRNISVRTHKGLELIPVANICYFLADQKYVTARHKNGQVLIDDTLKELEQEFTGRFIRIHRNALIAFDYLEGLEQADDGKCYVRLSGIDERLIVSRRHVAGIRKLMQKM